MPIPASWLTLLFLRFREIYGNRADGIDKTPENWLNELEGVTADEIRRALGMCKADTSVLPTPNIFKELCKRTQKSQITEVIIDDPIAPHYQVVKPVKAANSAQQAPQDKGDWQKKLLAMDETAALSLSAEDRYDRTRLLLEKEGRERVIKMQAVASNKPEIKRSDWG